MSAIGISAPVNRLNYENIKKLSKILKNSALTISNKIKENNERYV